MLQAYYVMHVALRAKPVLGWPEKPPTGVDDPNQALEQFVGRILLAEAGADKRE